MLAATSTNTVEASFAILKRCLIGTFHSVSEKHLQRYCNEFDFRWNTRTSQGFSDTMRAEVALRASAASASPLGGLVRSKKPTFEGLLKRVLSK